MSLSNFKKKEDFRYVESTTWLEWFWLASKPQPTHILVQVKTKHCYVSDHRVPTQDQGGKEKEWKIISKTPEKCIRHCNSAKLCIANSGDGRWTDVWRLQGTAAQQEQSHREGTGMLLVPGKQLGLSWDLTKTEQFISFTPYKVWKRVSPSATSLGLQANFQNYQKHEPPHQWMLSIYCQCKPFRLIKPDSFFSNWWSQPI